MNKRLKLFGSRLKETIEEKGVSVNEISKATKIRKVFIEALLNGDKENLPDQVFVLGYLKAILDFLKVDQDSYLEEYKALTNMEGVLEEPKREDFYPLPELKSKNHYLLWLVVVALILIFSAFFLFRVSILEIAANIFSKTESSKEIKIVEVNPQKISTIKENQINAKEEKDISFKNVTPISLEGLVIKSSSRCWIELFDENEKILMKREVTDGEELNFKGNVFKVTLGDPSAVSLFLNGKEISFPKEKGKVLRDFKVIGETK